MTDMASDEHDTVLDWIETLPAHVAVVSAIVEINSQLTPIIGFLELIDMGAVGPVPAPIHELLKPALRAARRARVLIPSVIEAARRLQQERMEDDTSAE